MKKMLLAGLLITLHVGSFAQKSGWQHLDLKKDSVFGISADRAYNELLKNKKPVKVIVGIVDCGVDTLQEDLKAVIWTDPKTGHHGWNYIGGETGREDITNLVNYKRAFYDSLALTPVPEAYRDGYQAHQQLAPVLEAKIGEMKKLLGELQLTREMTDDIVRKIGKGDPTTEDFKNYKAKEGSKVDIMQYSAGKPYERAVVDRIIKRLFIYKTWKQYHYGELEHIIELIEYHLAHGLNLNDNEEDTNVGDFDISPDKFGPVSQPNMFGAYHGTHVAGIIGAVRNNGIGMNGIADDVELMMLKDNGTLRELRDHCLAQAIRFAVDHGAKIINMSFGKPYTWKKTEVDDAVKYAMKHDVLLIHAAGNAGENLDTEEHYPNPVFLDKSGKANNWLEVGASGPKNDSTLCANFSNYGKRDVDVFAPGVAIYSTLPYNQYVDLEGTSMAAPVVTGLAALIREYYPKLTAVQVRDIIMRTVVRSPYLKDKCVSGGVVNAYSALKLAATYK